MFILMFRILLVFLVLAVIYKLLASSQRKDEIERLAREFDANEEETDRDIYIAQGMSKFENSSRPKRLWGVFVLPLLILVVLIYLGMRT